MIATHAIKINGILFHAGDEIPEEGMEVSVPSKEPEPVVEAAPMPEEPAKEPSLIDTVKQTYGITSKTSIKTMRKEDLAKVADDLGMDGLEYLGRQVMIQRIMSKLGF